MKKTKIVSGKMAKPILLLVLACGLFNSSFMTDTKPVFYPVLQTYCETLPGDFSKIPEERKETLREIGGFVVAQLNAKQPVNLTYICTHNSRRSQFGQVWAKVAAVYYGFGNRVFTFSGGTEATAFNVRAVAALQRAGFVTDDDRNPKNPNHTVRFSESQSLPVMFSKRYSDEANPKSEFCAVMVCSQADEACPLVYGASARVSLPYEDPKNADGKPNETKAYDETCRLIARETFYVFDYVRRKMNQ